MTSSTEIGDPPKGWKAAQKKAWRDFVAELPHLNGEHRALLEIASDLRAYHSMFGAGGPTLAVYVEVLRLIGATPVAAGGVTIVQPEE